ncbi:MAG: ribonuclease HII [Bacteroidota bacterium]
MGPACPVEAAPDPERELRGRGVRLLAGVDEAGRGPMAGPVVAAAVVFLPGVLIAGVRDSKCLAPGVRHTLCRRILQEAAAVGVGVVDHRVIDRINILQATFRAMRLAVEALGLRPDHLLVDGDRFPPMGIPHTAVVRGDGRCFSVAAASIVAKVTRDGIMAGYDRLFPGYGFIRNRGYATAEHRTALRMLGRSPIHRRSFILHAGEPEGEAA